MQWEQRRPSADLSLHITSYCCVRPVAEKGSLKTGTFCSTDLSHNPDELANLLFSCCKNETIGPCLITTRAKSGHRQFKGVDVNFIPSSLYCYELGHNIIAGKKSDSGRRQKN